MKPDHGTAPRREPEIEPGGAIWLTRLGLGLLGLVFAGWGMISLAMQIQLQELWPIGRWGVGGILVSDALLAPMGVAAGWLIVRRLRARTRPLLRAGLLGLASMAILFAAFLGGRQNPQNPTVVATDPLVAILVALVALVLGIDHRRNHQRRRTPALSASPSAATPEDLRSYAAG